MDPQACNGVIIQWNHEARNVERAEKQLQTQHRAHRRVQVDALSICGNLAEPIACNGASYVTSMIMLDVEYEMDSGEGDGSVASPCDERSF